MNAKRALTFERSGCVDCNPDVRRTVALAGGFSLSQLPTRCTFRLWQDLRSRWLRER